MARASVLCKKCCSLTTTRSDELCSECRPAPRGTKFTEPIAQRAGPASDVVYKGGKASARPKSEPTSDAEDACSICGKPKDQCRCDKLPAQGRDKLPNRGGGAPAASTPSAATPGAPSVEAKGTVQIGPVAVRSLDQVALTAAPRIAAGLGAVIAAVVGAAVKASATCVTCGRTMDQKSYFRCSCPPALRHR